MNVMVTVSFMMVYNTNGHHYPFMSLSNNHHHHNATENTSISNIHQHKSTARNQQSSRLLLEEYYYSGWIKATSLLPRADISMSICYFDGNIFLFGGAINKHQLVEYDVLKDTMYDKGESVVSVAVGGTSWPGNQYYTRIDNLLYWINDDGIVTYKLLSVDSTVGSHYSTGITMTYTVTSAACLTSNDNMLFVLGGLSSGKSMNTVQIFNISSSVWIYPQWLRTSRHYHSCVVDPMRNELWAIGGIYAGDRVAYLKSVEKISIEHITNNTWKYTQDLIQQVFSMGVILHHNVILVMGGSSAADNVYSNKVQVIHCDYGNVTIGGYLSYAVYGASTILVDDRLYMFGGAASSGTGFQKWQYLDLPTQIPTSSPISSVVPITNQTNNPMPESTTFEPNTFAPTKYSQTDTSSSLFDRVSSVETRQYLERAFHVFLYSFVSFVITVSVIGFIHSKYIRQNDFFRISLVFTAGLQITDMCSDCFFVYNLSTHIYETDDIDISNSYLIVTVLSVFLIVIPVTISICQLWRHVNNHWMKTNRINVWIAQFAKYLYLLSFVCGSSFTAISLLNCNFCTLSIFCMGLSKIEMTYFSTKRLHSTIMLQNVPQIGIQIWYLVKSGNTSSYITISSLTFSLISIIVTVLSLFNSKKIINSQNCIKVTMDIVGEYDPDKCSTKISKIKKYFTDKVFGDNFVELLRPTKIRNGLQFTIQLYLIDCVDDNGMDDSNYTVNDYRKLLNQVTTSNELSALIQTSWNMINLPLIQHIEVEKITSKYSSSAARTQLISLPFIANDDNDDSVYWSMDDLNRLKNSSNVT